MNAEQLRNAIWKIDDKFIAEAEIYEPEEKSGKTIWIITSVSAAVIALCTCIHYYNASDFLYRPEIDNTVVMTTTVSETESYETDVIKTVKPVPLSDTVIENTEFTESESRYETSIPYAVTVNMKTEVPSGNGGSTGEITVLTHKPQEVTKVPATEPAKVTAEVKPSVPVTEPAVTDKPPETKKPEETLVTAEVHTTAADPTPAVPASETYPRPVPTTPTDVTYPRPSPTTPAVETNPGPVMVPSCETDMSTDTTIACETEYSEVSLEDFPQYLINSDGVYYNRTEIVSSDKVSKLFKQEVMTDVNGNTYTMNVYFLKDYYSDTIRVIYFDTKNSYVAYKKSTNQ